MKDSLEGLVSQNNHLVCLKIVLHFSSSNNHHLGKFLYGKVFGLRPLQDFVYIIDWPILTFHYFNHNRTELFFDLVINKANDET